MIKIYPGQGLGGSGVSSVEHHAQGRNTHRMVASLSWGILYMNMQTWGDFASPVGSSPIGMFLKGKRKTWINPMWYREHTENCLQRQYPKPQDCAAVTTPPQTTYCPTTPPVILIRKTLSVLVLSIERANN